MGRKILLFLSGANCQACTWKNGDLSAAEYFSEDDGGKEKFTAFLQSHRDPIYLLTDLVEEDFRHESVPHLRGSERKELVQRKLEQYYRNTPFRQAITLQRSKSGRHDDDMLFSALTNPALITPWLNIMLAHKIPLGGIYSIPNISVPLIKDIPSGCLLLLSWEKNAGLRQTYFDGKLLRFSRLTPLIDGNSFGAAAKTEASRTQQYLKNLSLLPLGHELNVTVICHASDRNELAGNLIDDNDLHYAYLDIQELGRRIGAKMVYADSDATPLFMHLLASRPPNSHYAPAEQTHCFRLMQLRRSLLGVSAAFAIASLLCTSSNLMEYLALKNESRAIGSQSIQLSRETRQIIQYFPVTQASADDMKTAVMLSRNLDNIFLPPQIILAGLAKALDIFPSIRIDKLSWQTGLKTPDTSSSAAMRGSAVARGPAQVILLSGELAEFTGYRGALDKLERFRQALIQYGYDVTTVTLPLDVSPQGSIAADICDGSDKPAQFSLKITWPAKT